MKRLEELLSIIYNLSQVIGSFVTRLKRRLNTSRRTLNYIKVERLKIKGSQPKEDKHGKEEEQDPLTNDPELQERSEGRVQRSDR